MKGYPLALTILLALWCAIIAGCKTVVGYIPGVIHSATNAVVEKLDTKADSNEIIPDKTVKYNVGNEAADGGYQYEIWLANWHGMNIRVHANPGEFRAEGIPAVGKWYPLNMSVMPKDIITMQRTATGATFTAKDFTSPSGQRYRLEGFRADGIGKMSKVRRLDLQESQFGGAVFVWYATVE